MLISKFKGQDIDQQLQDYEDLIGSALPRQLCDFLVKYNGGETPNTSFFCNGVSSDIRGFYGLGTVKDSYNKVKVIEDKDIKYLPIAFDSFGNELLISLNSSEIYFRDHEGGSIQFLAKDLKEFIKCCKSDLINPASKKSIQEREQELIKNGRGSIITDALREMWQAEIDKYSSIIQEEVVF